MSIKAQPNTPRSRQWFKPSQRPPYEAGDTTHSITVLGYDPEDKIMEIKPQDIKDYLHLYIGCEVLQIDSDGDQRSVQLTPEILWSFSVDDGSFNLKPILRKLSDMTEEELRHCIELKEGGRLKQHQPLRRRVKTNFSNETFTQWYYEDFSGLRKIDETIVANLSNDENGLTLIGTNDYYRCYLKVLPYLIKQGFDLFGLIPAGLAIDKTSLKN